MENETTAGPDDGVVAADVLGGFGGFGAGRLTGGAAVGDAVTAGAEEVALVGVVVSDEHPATNAVVSTSRAHRPSGAVRITPRRYAAGAPPGGVVVTAGSVPPMTTLDGEYVPGPSAWVNDQVAAYERSGGREANTLLDTGIPVVIVTMRGATSGKLRKIALMRVEHEGEYALVASKGGAPDHPAWYHNLTAHPDEVLVQDGPVPFAVRVREVDGDERAAWWDRAVAVYAPYADYQTNTDRLIPVLVASPTG